MRHLKIEQPLRGTLAGLSHPDIILHLQNLNITAVELLPIHPIGTPRRLSEIGLRDYWGYNPINFFALEPRYLSNGDIAEFRHMVRSFHDAGIEVILDVVFNHTGEGDELGPTLSFRGIDNAAYYCLQEDKRRYLDFTGCHNTLNVGHPRVSQMILDSLRYWVEEMHVDGFRFDLAVSLARHQHHFSSDASFFRQIMQDPVLAKVKLIAEPWDLGVDGYQLGSFPPGWSEWNDRFRDTVRRFWRGEGGLLGDLAYRLTGSSDVFDRSGRCPTASVNYVTAHDGFTLEDLVSYATKHNEANGEGNADGANNNFSSTYGGPEGTTDDPAIKALRARQKRNIMATLLLSLGVPMILGGDEIDRTQKGNNNAYCQDNEISWVDWNETENRAFLTFVTRLLRFRADHPAFRQTEFFHGDHIDGNNLKDVVWLSPDGSEMTDADWIVPEKRCLGVRYAAALGAPNDAGPALLLLNAADTQVRFVLPAAEPDQSWCCMIDTFHEEFHPEAPLPQSAVFLLEGRSLALFVSERTA
jgi:glycogen operon protein